MARRHTAYDSWQQPPLRRRRWPIFVPTALVVVIAVAWSGFWLYARSAAEEAIAGWQAREAAAGRIYTCGSQSVGGYPFRIEVRCTDAGADLATAKPPLSLKTAGILVAAQVYQPTLLISEFSGPLTVAEQGRSPRFAIDWQLAQSSVRGLPSSPERVSMVIEKPSVDQIESVRQTMVAQAERVELHGRVVSGSASDNPVIEVVLRLAAATMPGYHPLTEQPTDVEIDAVLTGLQDFSAKPWPVRFREIQARDGRIEIAHARIAQGDRVAVGSGVLALTPQGKLDGELTMTVAGLEPVLRELGLDQALERAIKPERLDQISSTLNSFMPGLGDIARNRAGTAIAAGLSALGQKTTLEGKEAVTLPLRFTNGAASLGPIPLGETPPLF